MPKMAKKTARVHLTKLMVEKLGKASKRVEYVWDDDPPGLGVSITSTGTKTYIVDYTTREGVRRRLTLGRCDRMSLEEARIDARNKLSAVDRGGDPLRDRKAGRLKERMDELLDDYIAKEMPARKRASTIRVHTAQIEKHIRPALGSMAV